MTLRLVLVSILLITACRASRDTRSAATAHASPSLPGLPCFSADTGTIAFGTIEIAPETEDASGVQFSFELRDGRLLGFVRDAAGETPPRQALQEIQYVAAGDSLTFWFASGSSRNEYRLHVTCEALTGMATLFITPTYSGKVVRDTLRRAEPIARP